MPNKRPPSNKSRRQFLQQASLAAAAMSLPGTLLQGASRASSRKEKLRLIVDADTANEVDDLFAIARALIEPTFQVEGLSSAQWHTQQKAPNDSVGMSQKMNEDIARLMGITDVPLAMGANVPMVNTFRPQPSAAARLIIEKAHESSDGEQLVVVSLGPNTNVASAILMDPAIIPKLKVCYIGFWHDVKQNAWSKREFNTNNDPNATDLLLNTAALDFHVMTATTSQHLVFHKDEVDRHLKGKGGLGDYLVDRWESYDRFWQKTDKEKRHWIMWDVAIIEALANPALAKEELFITPDDNLQHEIHAYTWIDVEGMKKQYWEVLGKFLNP